MDSPLRLGVTNLVRQRGAGEISREDFFEQLARIQNAASSSLVAGAADQSTVPEVLPTNLADSWASTAGACPVGLENDHRTPFDSLDSSIYQHTDASGEWPSAPSLLTGEAARALILGTASHHTLKHMIPPSDQAHDGVLTSGNHRVAEAWMASPSPGSSGPTTPQSRHPFFAAFDDVVITDAMDTLSSREAAWQSSARDLYNNLNQDYASHLDTQRVYGAHPHLGAASTAIGRESLGLDIDIRASSSSPYRSRSASPARLLHDGSPRWETSPFRHGDDQDLHQKSLTNSPRPHLGVRQSRGSVDSSFASFAQRSEIWEMQRNRRWQDLRRQRDQCETAECPFQPNSAHPKRSAKSTPSRSSRGGTTNDRSCSSAQALVERLAKPITTADRDAIMWREQKDREEMKECTFQPNISKSSRSRRLSVSSSTGSLAASDAGLGPATPGARTSRAARRSNPGPRPFVPITNSVPKGMTNARAYLKEDVFSRLMQPALDMSALQGNSSNSAACDKRFDDPGDQFFGRDQVCDVSTMSKCRSAASLSEPSFVDFLSRQNACEEWRRERLQSLKYSHDPSFRPELCDRSVLLAARHRAKAERSMEMKTDSRGLDSVDASKEAALEAECSFRPWITDAAKQRERRGLTELSLGDQRRREAKASRLREQHLAKEMKEETFSPNITKSDVQSRLRVLQDPDSYMERMAKCKSIQENQREQERRKRIEKEMAECTFKPKVRTSAPEFVQRMAESFQLVRDLKEKENRSLDQTDADGQSRPEWR